MYSDTECASYDSSHYDRILHVVQKIKEKPLVADNDHISENEVAKSLSTLKTGKMCGVDNVCNEHLINGGDLLLFYLTMLFDYMYCFAYVPLALLRGIILTLYKGVHKPKNQCNSYRAITLSFSVLKLYENVLLNRLQNSIDLPIHSLQGGFQPQMSSAMTSFVLNESINFCREQNSKLYVCFLDARKAFDRVWHDGLVFKLSELRIPHKLLKTVIARHSDMRSCVLCNGFFSDWFPILQGTWQGGIWSPFLYLIYINDLIDQLVKSKLGFQIEGVSFCAPSFADDMTLQALSCKALQSMISFCYRYSCLWRYQYNPLKCAIVTFNETSRSYKSNQRSWFIGDREITEYEEFVHLGIKRNKSNNTSFIVKELDRKLRATFYGLIKDGLHKNGLNPLTSAKIYNSIVLPRALFGSELLQSLSNRDRMSLEKSHRLCLKQMQGLQSRSRTDIVLGLLGILPIEAEIEKKKLSFFGQLCRLERNCAAKQLFLLRLSAFMLDKSIYGFVNDIAIALCKFNLFDVMLKYIEDGSFPSRMLWKNYIEHK